MADSSVVGARNAWQELDIRRIQGAKCLCGAVPDHFSEAAVGQVDICIRCLRSLYWDRTDEEFSVLLEAQYSQAEELR